MTIADLSPSALGHSSLARGPTIDELHPASELDPAQREIRRRFGRVPVLIPIPAGSTKPEGDSWRTTTLAQTQTSACGNQLWNSSIGVLCGPGSGHLYALHFTDQIAGKAFAATNPCCKQTLITDGADGASFWFHVMGTAPETVSFDGFAWLGSGQCVRVFERDRKRPQFEFLTDGPPVEIRFEDLRWDWHPQAAQTFCYFRQVQRYGQPLLTTENGRKRVNPSLWGAFFAAQEQMRFHCSRSTFEVLDPASKDWKPVPEAIVKRRLEHINQ